jgi:deoxyadenosine/deoxycytidine kinase
MIDHKKKFEKYGIYPGYIDWFNNLKFPQPRKKLNSRTFPIIEVGADGMRVGKTTAVKVLVNGFKKKYNHVLGSFEDFIHNPYLKESYSDPKNAILHSQQWFATRKYQQLKQAPKNKIFIQDVQPEMDFCYAASNTLMGRMSLHQFEKYVKHYHALNWQKISQPDLLVYLKVTDKTLINRVRKSLREFETVDEKYFLIMKYVNRAWFKNAKQHMNILEIDTDNLDFSSNHKHQQEFVSLVEKKLLKLFPLNNKKLKK